MLTKTFKQNETRRIRFNFAPRKNVICRVVRTTVHWRRCRVMVVRRNDRRSYVVKTWIRPKRSVMKVIGFQSKTYRLLKITRLRPTPRKFLLCDGVSKFECVHWRADGLEFFGGITLGLATEWHQRMSSVVCRFGRPFSAKHWRNGKRRDRLD